MRNVKHIILVLMCVSGIGLAQNLPGFNGQCSTGGQAVITQGLPSSGTVPLAGGTPALGTGVIASYPGCLVNVYVTGTLTLASIFSNAPGTIPITQPFTANSDGSFLFFVTAGTYDITMSGGGMPAARSLTAVPIGAGGGGGTLTGATANGGLVVSGTTLGLFPNCSVGQVEEFNGTAWVCTTLLTGGNVSTVPVINQDIVQPIGTEFSVNNFANVRWATAIFNWLQLPPGTLTGGVQATVTLAPCPDGVDTSNFTNGPFYIYVSGVGTPEAATVTGGTCAPGNASGSIVFTPLNNHSAGFSVGSASSGIAEAWNAACGLNGALTGGYCELNLLPGSGLNGVPNYTIYATVFLTTRGKRKGMFHGNNANLLCQTRAVCVFDGTRANGGSYHTMDGLSFQSGLTVDGVQIADVTAAAGTYTVHTASAHPFSMTGNAGGPDYVDVNFYVQNGSNNGHLHGVFPVASVSDNTHFTFTNGNLTFSNAAGFGFAALENAAIEDNAQGSKFSDIQFYGPSTTTNMFSYGFVFDNDQKATVDNASISGNPLMCLTSKFCGSPIYARGDQGNASVVTVQNSDFSMNCGANGPLALSGNGFTIRNSVSQAGLEWNFYAFNNLVGSTQSDLYEAIGNSCTNPLYGPLPSFGASAGTMVVNGQTNITGAASYPMQGALPSFVSGGSTSRNYFVVPRSSTNGYGPILPIGHALPVNGGVSVPLQWPNIALASSVQPGVNVDGTVTWDILVTTGGTQTPLAGTLNVALATNISPSCNTAGICSYTDTQPALTSYVIQKPLWYPSLWYWPGTLVNSNSVIVIDTSRTQYISSFGSAQISMIASLCNNPAGPIDGSNMEAPEWILCGQGSSGFAGAAVNTATVRQQTDSSGNTNGNAKGVLNLGEAGNLQGSGTSTHLITLIDSNKPLTLATQYFRPANSVNDVALGTDCGASCLTLVAPTSISQYINNVGDGTLWLERLTATLKTIAVPVQVGLSPSGGSVTAGQFLSTTPTGTPPFVVSSTTNVPNLNASTLNGLGFTWADARSSTSPAPSVGGDWCAGVNSLWSATIHTIDATNPGIWPSSSILYCNSNPLAAAPSGAILRLPCSQIITSVTWASADGPIKLEPCIASSNHAANQNGTLLTLCSDSTGTVGCGPNVYPSFELNPLNSYPVGEPHSPDLSCYSSGATWGAHFCKAGSTLSTGTATFTHNGTTVTGSSVTWTSAMIGGFIVDCDNGTKPGACTALSRIIAVPSTTSLTLQSGFRGTTNAAHSYTIWNSNVPVAYADAMAGTLNLTVFGHTLGPMSFDLAGILNATAYLNPGACQERCSVEGIHVMHNNSTQANVETNQAYACAVWDATFRPDATGQAHWNLGTGNSPPLCTTNNGGGSTSYGWLATMYSITGARTIPGSGPSVFHGGTLVGSSGHAFQIGESFNGILGAGVIDVGHFEWVTGDAVEIGKTDGVTGLRFVEENYGNSLGGTGIHFLVPSTNFANTNNIVENMSSRLGNHSMVVDDANTATNVTGKTYLARWEQSGGSFSYADNFKTFTSVITPGVISSGTKFTSNAGCTESNLVGGPSAGTFKVGQNTACTIILTMGGGLTATTGWTCAAYDQTGVPAVAIRQTGSTTTTCSLLMTVATNDVITFSASGF